MTHVALLGATESSGTAVRSLSTSTTTGWAVSGDVANTTAGLLISCLSHSRGGEKAHVTRLVALESTTELLSTTVTSTEATLLSVTRLGAHSSLSISFSRDFIRTGKLTM